MGGGLSSLAFAIGAVRLEESTLSIQMWTKEKRQPCFLAGTRAPRDVGVMSEGVT